MNEGTNFGISRSKSFAGILSHVRTSSNSTNTTSSSGSSNGSGCHVHPRPESLGRSSVLGQYHRKSTGSLRNLGVVLAKIPKTPRPARTLAIFEAISNGLSECVNVTEDDINSLKGSLEVLSINSQQSQGKLYELEKQLKAAERYMKRLEYQLTSLEELQEQYFLQQKLRDGVCTMARAFVLSPGREKESALSNVRSGYKECVETLCWVEGQLEQMMGTLQMEMKGVQGFARLCSGDAFEITIRHGHQKWKSRGRILKNKQQTWDSQGFVFKALLGEILHIKAVEIKGLGKAIVLGNKYCETKELFCANPQIMTVNLNSSGSLKLSIIITWNPLDTKVDDQPFRPQTLPKTTTDPFVNGRPRIFPPHSLSHGSLSSQLTLNSHKDGSDSGSVGSGSGRSAHKDFMNRRPISLQFPIVPPRLHLKTTSLDSLNLNSLSPHQQLLQKRQQRQQSNILTMGLHKADSSDCCSMDLGSSTQGSNFEGPTLQEVVQALSSCLEDIQGQYAELHRLQLIVSELEQMILGTNNNVHSRRSSNSSEMSLSVELALECFDFLNTEVGEDEVEFSDDKLGLDPDLTAKTSDSGIASIAIKLRGLNSNSPESSTNNFGASTTSEQLDMALCTHLQACQRLITNVGSYGPLKCRERRSLDHLKSQTSILERLMKLSAIMKDKNTTVAGRDELKEDPQLQQLWDFCCPEKTLFCINSEHCYLRLSMTCQQYLPWGKQTPSSNNNVSEKVAKLIVCRIWDTGRFEPDSLITVHQFSDYFWRTCRSSSLDGLFRDLSEEVSLISLLQSTNVSLLMQTVSWQNQCLPPDECLWMMASLLNHSSKPLQEATGHYFVEVNQTPSLREKVLRVLAEGLESDVISYRQGACAALASLKAIEFTHQLAYLCQTDENPIVKQAAKSALLLLGPDGRRAFEQTQLTSLGFQGLAIQ